MPKTKRPKKFKTVAELFEYWGRGESPLEYPNPEEVITAHIVSSINKFWKDPQLPPDWRRELLDTLAEGFGYQVVYSGSQDEIYKLLLERVAEANHLTEYTIEPLPESGEGPVLRFKEGGKWYLVDISVYGNFQRADSRGSWSPARSYPFNLTNPVLELDPKRARLRELQETIAEVERQIESEAQR